MIDVEALVARLGRFGPADLPRYAEDRGARVLVDGAPVEHGFDLVVTVSDDDGDPPPDALVVLDAAGRPRPGRPNRQGQLRFDSVDTPPWHLALPE